MRVVSALIPLGALLAGCGSVTPTSTDGAVPVDAAGTADRESPDAPMCSDPSDCDDGLVCNGVEDCPAGSCVAGTPLSCGTTDTCTTRGCDEPAGCSSSARVYDISATSTFGLDSSTTLTCADAKQVDFLDMGCMSRFICDLDASGRLMAWVDQVSPCSDIIGPRVSSGCSTAAAGTDSFTCCFL